MAYLPDFSRNAKGKFDPTLNFLSVKGGSDAFLIEDEWNELQWIQINERAKLIRTMTHSGCLQISNRANTEEPGAYKAHSFLIRDENDQIIQTADNIYSSTELNNFVINPFYAVLHGHIVRIESNKPDGLVVYMPQSSATSLYRQDLVILEFWFKEIKPRDNVPLFGGVANDPVAFEMIDHRISIPSTYRVQLQWRIRAIEDKNENYHYDHGRTRIEYLNVHPQGPKSYDNIDYIYTTADFEPFNDPHMFVAGLGEETIPIFDTIDGYIYAIPLFEVNRLNNSGYHAYNNVHGSTNWQNTGSLSGRESLDGKFANVIYYNDIQDQRYQAYLGTNELNKQYVQVNNFTNYAKETKDSIDLNTQSIEELIEENKQLFVNLLAI